MGDLTVRRPRGTVLAPTFPRDRGIAGTQMICRLVFGIAGLAWILNAGSFAASAAIAQWDFNGDLASATGGSNLVAGVAQPAASPGVTFTTATINGQTATVASFTRGTYLRLTHGFAANGGGGLVNNYTLIMDVMFPSRPSGWAALWQT